MTVLETGIMPNGTDIQIEDWHDSYPFMAPASTLAVYPISQWTYPGAFAPKAGERFRAGFDFPDTSSAKEAFTALCAGEKQVKDYAEFFSQPRYVKCL